MAVGIAGSMTTAAIAVLGIIGAIVTYIASNYQDLTAFYILAALSALALISGIWQGMRGIAELTNKGFQGEWLVETKKGRFDKQSLATLIGLLLLGAAVIVGFMAPTKPPPSANVRATPAMIKSLEVRLAKDEVKIGRVETELTRIARESRHVGSGWWDRRKDEHVWPTSARRLRR